MAEYAVVLGVITIAVVVTLGLLSTAISNLLNNVIASLYGGRGLFRPPASSRASVPDRAPVDWSGPGG